MCNGQKDLSLVSHEESYFDEVVEQVDPLLQRFLQVLAERQVLGVVADLLHSSPLSLLCGLLRPVLVVVVSILATTNTKYEWE